MSILTYVYRKNANQIDWEENSLEFSIHRSDEGVFVMYDRESYNHEAFPRQDLMRAQWSSLIRVLEGATAFYHDLPSSNASSQYHDIASQFEGVLDDFDGMKNT